MLEVKQSEQEVCTEISQGGLSPEDMKTRGEQAPPSAQQKVVNMYATIRNFSIVVCLLYLYQYY